MRDLIIRPGDTINLGRQGENIAEQVQFDVAGWADLYGSGTYTLRLLRPGESVPYEAEVTVSGERVLWNVSDTDTAIRGMGEAQLILTVGSIVAKTQIYHTMITRSIAGDPTPPDPAQDWFDQVKGFSDDAEDSASDAEAWAVGERGGQAVPQSDETYRNNAKFYANAADTAKQSAEYFEQRAAQHADYAYNVQLDVERTAQDVLLYKGAPLVAATAAAMTDHSRVYVYVGSEAGYTAGNWYYWSGSAWTSGGVYNAVALQTDTTLSVAGVAADAAAVGVYADAIRTSYAPDQGIAQGGINTSTGAATNNDKRCRTDYIQAPPFGIDIAAADGYKFTVLQYATASVSGYDGNLSGGWVTAYNVSITTGQYIRLIIAKTNDTQTVTPEDCAGKITITAKTNTDETLTKQYKAADAKVTGGHIDLLEENVYFPFDDFENGNINSSGESNDSNRKPLRSGYIPVDEFVSIEVADVVHRYQLFAYSGTYEYLGFGNTTRNARTTRQDVLTAYPAAKYVRIKIGSDDSEETMSVESLAAYGYSGYVRISQESLKRIEVGNDDDVMDKIAVYANDEQQYTSGFQFDVALKNAPSILTITAQYSGTMPTIQIKDVNSDASSALTSPVYTLGGTVEPTRRSWRLPPESAEYNTARIIVTIPSGTIVTIRSAEVHDDQRNRHTTQGILYHGHRGVIAPPDTVEAFQLGAEVGYNSMITIPKFTSDDVAICYHDDSNVSDLRMMDGSVIPEAATTPISSKTYDYITQNWRLRSTAWGILHVPTLEQYFRVCSLTGMTPILSIHSSPEGMFKDAEGTRHFSAIRALAKKWNVLQGIGIKSGNPNIFSCARGVFGTDARYIWINGQSHAPYNVFTQMKNAGFIDENATDLSGCAYDLASEYFYAQTISGATYYAETMAQIADLLAKGFKISVAETDAISGPEMERLIAAGVTEFTVDSFISMGLDW